MIAICAVLVLALAVLLGVFYQALKSDGDDTFQECWHNEACNFRSAKPASHAEDGITKATEG